VLSNGTQAEPDSGDRAMSLALMRYCMLGQPDRKPIIPELAGYVSRFGLERRSRFGSSDFAAAVFIGGMEGVEREFNIFRYFHPHTPAWPIASTGAACVKLLESLDLPKSLKNTLMEDKVPYTRLFEELLGGKHRTSPLPRSFTPSDHLDPPGLGTASLPA
jgi:hypothetical protein